MRTLPATAAAVAAELLAVHRATQPGERVRFVRPVDRPPVEIVGLLLEGAGFGEVRTVTAVATAERRRTLPDWVRPRLRLLVCGLNPSLYAADTGVPFGRPGNRFWPAALAAGLVRRDRDLDDALRRGIGFTDLVKRATRASSELAAEEYRAGVERLARVAELFTPRAICFVGLEGVRKALDARAMPGWLATRIGGRPAYLMPSTSGRNANTSLAELAAHLRAASGSLPPRPRRGD